MSHSSSGGGATPPQEVLDHYAGGVEAARLSGGSSILEFARSQEIFRRFLPRPPAVIYDIGGGPGVYAAWLARLGYEVHLIDPVPLHVEQARSRSMAQPEAPIASCTLGDARRLDLPDASAGAVLLLGPLYHLTEPADRIAALREASRVLRNGGWVFAAAISRFASALDGLLRGFLSDPAFRGIVAADVRTGQHRNARDHPSYFTTAYFHHPDELRAEIEAVGLAHEVTLAVEGPAGIIREVWERWDDPGWRDAVLAALRQIEAEPSLLGASPHLLAIGRKASR